MKTTTTSIILPKNAEVRNELYKIEYCFHTHIKNLLINFTIVYIFSFLDDLALDK